MKFPKSYKRDQYKGDRGDSYKVPKIKVEIESHNILANSKKWMSTKPNIERSRNIFRSRKHVEDQITS